MSYVTGKTIKMLRQRRRITQKELAESIAVSDKTVSKRETGKGLPDIGIIEELDGALGVSVTELLTGDSGQWYRDARAFVSDCKTPEKFTQILLT